jgi:hypothetical protein
MSLHKTRVRALQALVAGMPCFVGHGQTATVLAEFNEVYAVRKIRRSTRRRLLEVLHSTRALDTLLAAFITHHGCLTKKSTKPVSLGGYLYALRDHSIGGLSKLSEPHRNHFQVNIVKVRNKYMHEAGATPNADAEIQVLLGEMHTCIAIVARL